MNTVLFVDRNFHRFPCTTSFDFSISEEIFVEQCGLFVKSDRPYIASSPDGIASYNCYPKAVLEIKCPFTLADKSVKDGWKNFDYLNMNDKHILELNQKHPYHIQLQRQMAVTGQKMEHVFVLSPKGSL